MSTHSSGNMYYHYFRKELLFLKKKKKSNQPSKVGCVLSVSCKLRPKFWDVINSNWLAKSDSYSLGQLWMVKFIKSRPLASLTPLDAAVISASLCQVVGSALKSPWHGFLGTYPSAAALFCKWVIWPWWKSMRSFPSLAGTRWSELVERTDSSCLWDVEAFLLLLPVQMLLPWAELFLLASLWRMLFGLWQAKGLLGNKP